MFLWGTLVRMTNISFPARIRDPRKRAIAEAVLKRDGYTCQMCGSAEGDRCLFDWSLVSLRVAAIVDLRQGGRFQEDNLRTVCSTCSGGLQALERRSRIQTHRDLRAGEKLAGEGGHAVHKVTPANPAPSTARHPPESWVPGMTRPIS